MKKEKIGNVNGDILALLEITEKIGWNGVRKISIFRIMYLASVLYSFRYPRKKNPFAYDYVFVVSLLGPYCDVIDNSLIYLQINEYVKVDKDEFYKLSTNSMPELKKLPNFDVKSEWLKVIVYILGIYGEEKVYDFVFRDPEYQEKVQTNSIKNINIEKGNKTYNNLINFKKAFEEWFMKSEIEYKNNDKKYLELYFEYVFSKILKGDME
ncbi:hypothetical protein ACOAKC_09345 [Hathewaya histolytica]|uniref:hypothetical protein n=1 Tax=Hathewaya histolytica TaxID=1498 RepID=UPI003B675D22